MITTINEYKKIHESKIDTQKVYHYKWSDYVASIKYSRIFESWTYFVNSVSTEYTNFRSHIDLQYDTPKECEEAMFIEIEDRIGSLPKTQF